MPKNKQSNLIANVKMPNISFTNKYIINLEIREKAAIQYIGVARGGPGARAPPN